MASSGKSIFLALLMALTVSSMMSVSLAARHLLQTTQPSVPNFPGIPTTLPKPAGFPPLPSIPTLPPNLPSLPKPGALPPIPRMPTFPKVPQVTLPPLPSTGIPSIPSTIPSIPFFSPPPSN